MIQLLFYLLTNYDNMFAVTSYPIALMLYFLGAIFQAGSSLVNQKSFSKFASIFGLSAITLHSFLLYHWIDVTSGQNLTEFNLLSLAIWLTAIFIMLLIIFRPVAYLNIIIYPLAGLSIILVAAFPASHIIQTANNFKQFSHILLSILTFSVLFLAGLQAVTLAIHERFLKQKNLRISLALPPIETMEKTLFGTIGIGVILLSGVLITSILFFHQVLLNVFLQKTILTFLAWLVFSSLLVGRFYFGWRGRKAIYCTLSGLAILSIIYFSSIIIMELLP